MNLRGREISNMKSLPESTVTGAVTRNTGSVLLVIDDEVMCDFVHGMCNSLGYFVVSFVNGPDAVESYRYIWNEIDLVVVDLAMPATKGVETVAALHRVNPEGNILLASGLIAEENARDWTFVKDVFLKRIKNGKNSISFIEKPYPMHELSRKIHTLAPVGFPGLKQTRSVGYGY